MPYSHLHPWKALRPWMRHSLVLMVAGLVYIMVGITAFTAEPTPAREKALQFATQWWSLEVWGAIFIFAGLLACISSRWPPVSETWGYTVLTGLSAGWAAFYGAGVVLGDSPASNLGGVFTWGLMAFMWWAISGLINPTGIHILLDKIKLVRAENEQLRKELDEIRRGRS